MMKISSLNGKSGSLRFSLYIKRNDKTVYYQENRGIILNRAKEYYKNSQGRLKELSTNQYRELLSEKEKNIKREYGRNRYKNMSEEIQQRLKEYQKKYCKAKKLT